MLKTERLILRHFEESDAENVFIVNDINNFTLK